MAVHKTFFIKMMLFSILFIFLDFVISVLLLSGLKKYYGFDKDPEILINGSSMAMSGFNRTELELSTNETVANYSHEGVSVEDRQAMINYFFHENAKGVKTVIYEVSPLIFSDERTADNVYTIFFPYLDDKFIDNYVKEKASKKEYYINKIIRTKRFDSRLVRLIIFGYIKKFDNLKTNKLDTSILEPTASIRGKNRVNLEKSKIEIFENTIDLIRSHNSSIILVMMPMYHIKFHSFSSTEYDILCKYFMDFCSSREGIEFLDLNQDSLIYNSDYFSDQLHFNVYGQEQITRIISSYLIE